MIHSFIHLYTHYDIRSHQQWWVSKSLNQKNQSPIDIEPFHFSWKIPVKSGVKISKKSWTRSQQYQTTSQDVFLYQLLQLILSLFEKLLLVGNFCVSCLFCFVVTFRTFRIVDIYVKCLFVCAFIRQLVFYNLTSVSLGKGRNSRGEK